MPQEFEEVKIGAEGVDYIRESLSGGKRLSRAVLDRLDSERGVLTTFVPPMTPTEELTRFHIPR